MLGGNDEELRQIAGIAAKADFSACGKCHWVVALSGGADSRMLLQLARENADACEALSLQAVYVHHHLQQVADEWAIFCGKECHSLGIEYHVEHVQVSHEGSVEANAREARYRALAKYVNSPYHVLFTAHHADDLIETMLMALVRGCGITGISAIPPVQPFASGRLVRPMLNISRIEVEQYCHGRHLSFVTDPTNSDTKFDRNFLRHEVVPVIKRRFPQIVTGAVRVSENLRDDLQLLDDYLAELIENLVNHIRYAGPGLSFPKVNELAEKKGSVYKASLIRYFLKKYFGITISRIQLAEIMKFADCSNDARSFLNAGDYGISVYRNHLIVVPVIDEKDFDELVMQPGDAVTVGKVRIYLDELNDCDEALYSVPDSSAVDCREQLEFVEVTDFYDLEDFPEGRLKIQFHPAGALKLKPQRRAHSQVLKQLWKEYGVPLYVRILHPVIYNGNNIPVAVHGVFKTENSGRHFSDEKKLIRKLRLKIVCGS
ncbi:MAG: tRNA lysidine(34) synthetase TilS [Ruminobacter sp.]|nr:tRNA lysidine(34) synthetase TilS [Ruminobacter sp.]